MYTIQRAHELARNSRVVREGGTLPYLVDRVRSLPDGLVEVTYSSGDVVTYHMSHPLVTVEAD